MALTGRRAAFVAYYCGEAKQNASEAARLAGYRYPAEEGHRLLRNAQIMQAVADFRSQLLARNIAHKQFRVDSYVRDFVLIERVIAERAEDYADEPLGASTGLVAKTTKTLGVGRTVDEYTLDTGLIEARLKLRKQLAQELGEWVERAESTVTLDVRAAAEKVAKELGIDADVVLSESTRWVEDEA